MKEFTVRILDNGDIEVNNPQHVSQYDIYHAAKELSLNSEQWLLAALVRDQVVTALTPLLTAEDKNAQFKSKISDALKERKDV